MSTAANIAQDPSTDQAEGLSRRGFLGSAAAATGSPPGPTPRATSNGSAATWGWCSRASTSFPISPRSTM
jgi:hypothetical protein